MMKKNILWICNLVFPEIAALINAPIVHAGGWMIGASAELKKSVKYNLYILSVSNYVDSVSYFEKDGIFFYVIPPNNYQESYRLIKKKICPEIVHVFGTELPHSWDVIQVFKKERVIVSIQGLTSEYYNYYTAELPNKVVHRKGIYEIITGDTIERQKYNFFIRGEREKELLRNVKYVIGRTEWDKAITEKINREVIYLKCNETLRKEFYDGVWSIENVDRYSIFISQGSYPIKGLHFAIEAMHILKSYFENIILYIAGENILKNAHYGKKWKMSSYAKYIYELIMKYKLEKNIIFLGSLSAEEMYARYIRSHVYLCPSSIENSPNSLGEAMILGTPCVASWVGGIPSLMEHKKEGFLYQYNAPAMLAYYIKNIFENDNMAIDISCNARTRAALTHNVEKNNRRLLEIYEQVLTEAKATDAN